MLQLSGCYRGVQTRKEKEPRSCLWKRQVSMVDHTVKVSIPIFNAVFLNCQAAFFFDSASNHPSHTADALRVEIMDLHPGGKQSVLREVFMHRKGQQRSVSFPLDCHNLELAGKLKGI